MQIKVLIDSNENLIITNKNVVGTYQLEVNCNGFLQAFFLLTADAIRSGKHYQLNSITDENGSKKIVGDILKCGDLLV